MPTEMMRLSTELNESLEYQTATSELLEVISRSTSDIHPVLDTLLNSAGRLCGTNMGGVVIRQGDAFRYVATFGIIPESDRELRAQIIVPGSATIVGRAML